MTKKQNSNKLTNSKLKQTWSKFQDWRARAQQRQRDGKVLPDDGLADCQEIKCLNCGHSFRGHNCPNCGQAADTKRITLRARVEHVFGYCEQSMRGMFSRAVGFARNAARNVLTSLVYNMMRYEQIQRLGMN